ncbi:MAG: hypothetical protein K6D96_11305 [Acetatifactor sp.]|nr:hypothetical protein [Acetatifactor sp.]
MDVFYSCGKELSEFGITQKDYTVFGGRDGSDRCVVRFGNPETFGYEVDFPIVCINVKPLNEKFADSLSHRDFLGALMNLGIDRSTVGDIIASEKEAYVFCLDSIAEYICENLSFVRHTSVICKIVDDIKEIRQDPPATMNVQVASERIDAVLSKVLNISRGDCLDLFRAGKVFLNGRLCENNSKAVKGGDVVNARGYGKFVITGEMSLTRKGKLNLKILRYR